jgi:hypothetical protein
MQLKYLGIFNVSMSLTFTCNGHNLLALSMGPNRVPPSPHLRMETDPVSEMLWFLVFRKIMGKVQKCSNCEDNIFGL